MRMLRTLFLIFAAVCCCTTIGGEDAKLPMRVKPFYVIDGDTFVASADWTVFRLYGVDAPEHDQPWGKVATEVLRQLLYRRMVTIQSVHGSTYNRPVVTATVRGQDVGLYIIRMGLAWHDPKYAPEREDYAAAQAEAKREKRGLWIDANPIPPWEWRAKQKK